MWVGIGTRQQSLIVCSFSVADLLCAPAEMTKSSKVSFQDLSRLTQPIHNSKHSMYGIYYHKNGPNVGKYTLSVWELSQHVT